MTSPSPPPIVSAQQVATASPGRRGALALVRRVLVAVAGACTIVVGLVLVPLPGPGWFVVFLGFALLGSEFAWADRVRQVAQDRVARGSRWSAAAPWPVRVAVGAVLLATLVVPVVVLVVGA